MSQLEELYNLEVSLLEYSTRTSQDYLNHIIADHFIEFGSSGRIWTQEDVLKSLPSEKPSQFKISSFQVIEQTESLAILAYSLEYNNKHTLRSSVWKNYEGTWKIIFHQGTKVEAEPAKQ